MADNNRVIVELGSVIQDRGEFNALASNARLYLNNIVQYNKTTYRVKNVPAVGYLTKDVLPTNTTYYNVFAGVGELADSSDFTNPDATKKAKVPTVGAILDGLNDGIYDVSKRNPTGGPNSDGKFTLEYILSNANTLIPMSWRHGGMVISFVSTSDNKYVQYMYHGTSTAVADFTNTTNWEKINLEAEVNLLVGEIDGGFEEVDYETDVKNIYLEYRNNNWTYLKWSTLKSCSVEIEANKTYKIVASGATEITLLKTHNYYQGGIEKLATGITGLINIGAGEEYTFITPADATYLYISLGLNYPTVSPVSSLGKQTEGLIDEVEQNTSSIKAVKANIGYYECQTAANNSSKTISASNYALLLGGSIKIKMTNENTAENVTLQIGTSEAKPLYYHGHAAGASNSWEAGEIVEVYYDGTSYYANNVAGGGDGNVFNISQYNAVGGVPTTYDSLSDALGVDGANVPEAHRTGGLEIKYLKTVLAKYGITKTEGLTEAPTGTMLNDAPSIADGVYIAEQLTDFSTAAALPATVGDSVTYYIAVTVDEDTTYTTWAVVKLSDDFNEYVNCHLVLDEWSVNVAFWENTEERLNSLENEVNGSVLQLNHLSDVKELVFNEQNRQYVKWSTATSCVLPILPNKKYKVIANKDTVYSIFSTSNYVKNGFVTYATGINGTISISAGEEIIFTSPNDGYYLYLGLGLNYPSSQSIMFVGEFLDDGIISAVETNSKNISECRSDIDEITNYNWQRDGRPTGILSLIYERPHDFVGVIPNGISYDKVSELYYFTDMLYNGFSVGNYAAEIHASKTQFGTSSTPINKDFGEGYDGAGRPFRGYDIDPNTYPLYAYVYKFVENPAHKFVLTANIHGAEYVAAFTLAYFMRELLMNTSNNPIYEWIKQNCTIVYIPTLNPWGLQNNTRYNGRFVDMNRNFDYNWESGPTQYGHDRGESAMSESEVSSYINYITTNHSDAEFVLECHDRGGVMSNNQRWLVVTNTAAVNSTINTCMNDVGAVIKARYSGYYGLNTYTENDANQYNYMSKVVGIPSCEPEFAPTLDQTSATKNCQILMQQCVDWMGLMVRRICLKLWLEVNQ